MDWDLLLRIFKALDEHKVRYVLVGAIALAVKGLPRATEDVDLFLEPDEENITALTRALQSIWNDPELSNIKASDLAGDYPVVRYGPPDQSLLIDLIGRLGTAFAYKDLSFETIEMEGVPIRVATAQTLYKMKNGTLREQDRADASALRARFGLEEER